MGAGYVATSRPYSSATALSTGRPSSGDALRRWPHRPALAPTDPDRHPGTALAKTLGTFFLERFRSIVICLYFTNSPRSGAARIVECNTHQPIFRPVGTTIPI